MSTTKRQREIESVTLHAELQDNLRQLLHYLLHASTVREVRDSAAELVVKLNKLMELEDEV